MAKRKTKPDDNSSMVHEAREDFERLSQAEQHNRLEGESDIRFSKLGAQWPKNIREDRDRERRPVLTINKMPAFIRQVVNDSRMNKPSIKVRPVDSQADVKTADIISGLIKNIEYVSSADVAYDTAIESAVAGGWGYIRVGMDYAYDDAFEMDINIDRVLNQFSVYGDPEAQSADGSDWNVAMVVDRMSEDDFKKKYKGKAEVDFDSDAWTYLKGEDWLNDEGVMIAEWWTREEVEREIVLLSDERVFSVEQLETDEDLAPVLEAIQMGQISVVGQRMAATHKVRQRIVSGVDVLEDNDWPGRYIPIVPIYGDEFCVKGKRYFRSLINPAKDAQRMHNYWRTTATELTALAPRVPFIGPKGSFDSDIDRWMTANTHSHPFLEYDNKGVAPQRQPLDSGVAAGALQEALNASDDMKAIMGMYDASLGARSNETSGRAILARQREGDVSTFHFLDNLSRGIRQVGKIVIDLIPHVYNKPRVVRVIGEDGKERSEKINQPSPQMDKEGKPVMERVPATNPQTGLPARDPQTGQVQEVEQPVIAMHDLTVGKYDVTVEAGPSFTTQREESAEFMKELIRAYPPAAPVIGDLLVRQFDWPGADDIAERLEKLNPTNKNQIPPELQKQIQAGMQEIQKLRAENEALKQNAGIEQQRVGIEQQKVGIDKFEAITGRIKAAGDIAGNVASRGMK